MQVLMVGSVVQGELVVASGTTQAGWAGCLEGTMAAWAPFALDCDEFTPVCTLARDEVRPWAEAMQSRYGIRFNSIGIVGVAETNYHRAVFHQDGTDTAYANRPAVPVTMDHLRRFVGTGIEVILVNGGDVGAVAPTLVGELQAHFPTAWVHVDPHRNFQAIADDGQMVDRAWEWAPMLRAADSVFLTRSEAEATLQRTIVTHEDAMAALAELHRGGVRVAIIGLGRDGLVVLYPDGCREYLKAEAAEVVSHNGAGDALGLAFSMSVARSMSLSDAVRLANLYAGIVCGFDLFMSRAQHMGHTLAHAMEDTYGIRMPRTW